MGDKMTCDALDKKYIMLEKNMEDECSAVDTDDGDDGMCDQLTFEVVPKCMEQEKMDAEDCFERVGEELEDVGVMEKCKCRAYKKIKEDFLVTMELFCDNEGGWEEPVFDPSSASCMVELSYLCDSSTSGSARLHLLSSKPTVFQHLGSQSSTRAYNILAALQRQ